MGNLAEQGASVASLIHQGSTGAQNAAEPTWRGDFSPGGYRFPVASLPLGMAKQMSAKKKLGADATRSGAAQVRANPAAVGGTPPDNKPGAVSLTPIGARRGVKSRPEKPTPKELSALANKEARARWSARMDAEGR